MANKGQAQAIKRGRVRWFDAQKGFGFIGVEGQSKDVFVHYSAINAGGYKKLDDNQEVEFSVIDTPKGPQAVDVTPL